MKKKYSPLGPLRHKSWPLKQYGIGLIVTVFTAVPPQAHSQESRFISFNHDTDISLCLTSSPDGKNVYAGGPYTIAAFSRAVDGTVATLQVLNNYHDGVTDIEHVIDLAVSPDGRHLYAVSIVNRALLIFSRDTLLGEISLNEILYDSVLSSQYGPFPAIEARYRLLIAPDGAHLYWLYHDADVLAVFERDQITGHLKKIQILKSGDPELGQFQVPSSIVISADGKYVFSGGDREPILMLLTRDTQTGRLNFLKSYDITLWLAQNERWFTSNIAVSPNDETVYLTSRLTDKMLVLEWERNTDELKPIQAIDRRLLDTILPSPLNDYVYVGGNGGILVCWRDPSTHELNPIEYFTETHGLDAPYRTSISPDGQNIYMNNVVLQRDRSNRSLGILQRIDHNLGGTDRLYTSHAVEVSPEGEHLYVAAREPARGIGDAGINLFHRNPNDGRITFAAFDTLTDIGGMLLSPEGRHLYVQSSASNAIHVFAREAQTGVLQMTQTVQPLPQTRDTALFILSPGMMAFSEEGAHFYFNTSEHLLVYDRDASTGQLTLQQTIRIDDYQLGLKSAFALSPEGAHVYWGGYEQNVSLHQPRYEMAIFSRDPVADTLTFVKRQSFAGMFPGYVIKVSHDGRHVYAGLLASNYEQNTGEMLGVFSRDAASGELRLQEIMRYGGYENCVDLAIAPNDSDVYAVFDDPGWSGSALAMFERERATGKLRQRKLFQSWREGVYGLYDPVDFKLSPDGRFIYLADLQGVVTFATGRDNTNSVSNSAAGADDQPKRFALHANYPNPFNPTTVIKYDLPQVARVTLTVYDVLGHEVRTLVNGQKEAGYHFVVWDGKNEFDLQVSSGVYFCRIQASTFTRMIKMTLMR